MKESISALWTRRTGLASAALVVAFVVVLHFEGRPAWCKSGPALWAGAWSSCTSQNFLDPYSFTHVLHGVIFFGSCGRSPSACPCRGGW